MKIRKVIILTLCISTFLLSGCSKNVSLEEVIQTTDLLIFNEFTSGENFITDEVLESNSDAKDIIAFKCYYHSDDGTEGGGYTEYYYVTIKDNIISIYNVWGGTTADNGYAIKYEQAIDNESIEIIKGYVENNSWKNLYKHIQTYINQEDGIVVSEGMCDIESRTEDGTYLWEKEFYSNFQ